MAYRRSTIGSSGYSSPGFGASDPMGDALAGTPEAMSPDQGFLSEDADLRTAAAYEYTRDRTAVPEDGGGRSGWGEYSLMENLIMLPGSTALEGGLETASARVGELAYGLTRAPQTVAEALGKGEWWEENAPEVRGYIKENMLEPIFGNRELIDQEYDNNTWASVSENWKSGNKGLAIAQAPGMILKEGLGSVPDMVALLTGPVGLTIYGTSRTSEIAEGRADASGETNTAKDIAIAAGTMGAVTMLDRVGLGKIINKTKLGGAIDKAGQHWASRAASAAGTEAATEAVQEHLEFVGEMVRDDFSDLLETAADPAAMEAAIAGAIIGGGVGGGMVLAGDATQSYLDSRASTTEGPGADLAAGAQGALPEPEGPAGLLPSPTPQLPAPAVVTPPPTPDQPEPGFTPPPSAAEPQGDIAELGDVAGQTETGEDAGPAEAVRVAAPTSQEPLPQGLAENLNSERLVQYQRTSEDIRRGQELANTGVGKFVQQAIESPVSKRDQSMSIKKIDEGKFGRVTEQDKLRAQQKRVSDASRSPGGLVIDLLDNLSKLTAYQAEELEGDYQAEVQKRLRNVKREDRGDVALDRSMAKREADMQTERARLENLSRYLRDMQTEAQLAIKDGAKDVSIPALVGAVERQGETLDVLGLDGEAFRKAAAGKSAPAMRKAIEKAVKDTRNRIRSVEDSQGRQLTGIGGRSYDPRTMRDRIDQDVADVMGENEKRGRTGSKNTVELATAETMYTTMETDPETGAPKRVSTVPQGSPEAAERRAAVLEEQRVKTRQLAGPSGKITDYTMPGQQYETQTNEAGEVISEPQPVRRRTPVATERYYKAGEEPEFGDTPEQEISRLEERIEELEEQRLDQKGKARLETTKKIKDLQARIFQLERGGQFDATEAVAPKELAEQMRAGTRMSTERAPSGNKRRLAQAKAKVFKEASEDLKAAEKLDRAETRLAEAERAAKGELTDAQRQALAAEKKQAKLEREWERKSPKKQAQELKEYEERRAEDERSKELSRQQQDQKDVSGVVNETVRGVSKARRAKAAKVFDNYRKRHKDTGKGLHPEVIKQEAINTRSQKVGSSGLLPLAVLDPTETDPKRILKSVHGHYPKAKITRGKDGRISSVKRATPHRANKKDANYSQLKNRVYYMPEDVIPMLGTRVAQMVEGAGNALAEDARARLKDYERVIVPEEMDSLLEFLGKQDFDWDGEPDEIAMAQWLIETAKGASKSKRKIKTPVQREFERRQRAAQQEAEEIEAQEREEREAGYEDVPETIDDGDYPVEDEGTTPLEEPPVELDPDLESELNAVLQEWLTNGSNPGVNVEGMGTVAALRMIIDERIKLANQAQQLIDDGEVAMELYAVPGGEVLEHELTADWPLDDYREIEIHDMGDGRVAQGDPDFEDFIDVEPNETVQSAMVRAGEDMAQGYVDSYTRVTQRQLEELEKLNAPGSSTSPSSGTQTEGTRPGPVEPDVKGDGRSAGQRRLGADDPRSSGARPVDPDARQAQDLYGSIGPGNKRLASFIKRARTYEFSGDNERKGLNEVQVDGVAKLVRQWVKAKKRGWGGFLNIDGTGLGKSRQVAAAADIIAKEEAKAGTQRPVLILTPGRMDASNPFIANITNEMELMNSVTGNIDMDAKHANGQPYFEFRPYTWLNDPTLDTEYAAVLADEAHGVKGTSTWYNNFNSIRAPFRAFFSATPTDKAGQELYYLEHITGRSRSQLVQALGLKPNPNTEKGGYVRKDSIDSEEYVMRLEEQMAPLAQDGAVVSRTYGRISDNFTNDIAQTSVDGEPAGSLVDQEAAALYEQMLNDGHDLFGSDMMMLTEHMKVPYMVARTIQQVRDGRKVIATFRHVSDKTDGPLAGTKFAKSPIARYVAELNASDEFANLTDSRDQIGVRPYYGSKKATKNDTSLVLFQDNASNEDGDLQVLAISDSSGATGLNLNDKWGDHARYMLISMTSYEGEKFMQLLGRHDRRDNRSVPMTEFAKVDNQTDKFYRDKINEKIEIQNAVAGLRVYRGMHPGLITDPINESEEFKSRKRTQQTIADGSSKRVVDKLRAGQNNAIDLVQDIAVMSDDPELAALAGSLLKLRNGWQSLKVRMMRDNEFPDSLGTYYPGSQTVAIRDDVAAAQTLLHEVVHHFTNRAIKTNLVARNELNQLRRMLLEANPDLRSRFQNAFSNLDEFVAEAFSDPSFQYELHNTRIKGGKKLSMFQRFVSWVGKTLGIRDTSESALQKILDLDLFTGPQKFDFDNVPLHRLKLPGVTTPLNTIRKWAATEDKVKYWPASIRQQGDTLRKGMLKTMTYEQIVDTYKKYFNTAKGNIVQRMQALQQKKAADNTKYAKAYEAAVLDPLNKFAQGTGQKKIKVRLKKGGSVEEITQMQYLAHLMNVSGYAGVHFGKHDHHPANSRLGKLPALKGKKMGKGDPNATVAWDIHHKQTQREEFQKAMELYNQMADFFARDRTMRLRITAGVLLDNIFPKVKGSWTNESVNDIRKELKRLGELDRDEQKTLGIDVDAMSDLRDMMEPGKVSGAYFPLRRYGDYVVTAKGRAEYNTDAERDALLGKYPSARDKDGAVIFTTVARFDTQRQAEKYRDALQEEYKDIPDDASIDISEVEERTRSVAELTGMVPYSALATQMKTQIQKRTDDPAIAEQLQRIVANSILDLMPESSIANQMREREGVHGASLDPQRVLHDYGSSYGYTMSNLRNSREGMELLNELREHTFGGDQRLMNAVRDELVRRENMNMRNPNDLIGKWGQRLNDVGFLFYLVGVSYNVVNATQPALVTQPWLGARYGQAETAKELASAYSSVGGAPFKRLMKTGFGFGTAAKDAVSNASVASLMRGQLFGGKDFDRGMYDIMEGKDGVLAGVKDPQVKEMLKQLVDENLIESTLAKDTARGAERAHMDEQGRPIAASNWQYVTDWMRMAPHVTEVMNRSVTATAAFNLEMKKSGNYDKALSVAREAVSNTQFNYQGWNSPPAFNHPAGRIALMFKKHVQHMYYFMVRNAAVSVAEARKLAFDESLSEAERKVAKQNLAVATKALGMFVGLHVLLAGAAGGTPEMIKWMIGLGFLAFGDDDEPFKYDQWLRNVMFDAFGEAGATFASQGLPGFLGMDFSSRIGIDSMLFFDTPNIDSREGFAYSLATTAGGPMMGLAFRGIDAKGHLNRGDYDKLLESVSPKMVRDVVRANRNLQEGFVDNSGKTYLSSEEYSWWDFTQQALGFTPKTSSDIYESRSVGRTRQGIVGKRNDLFTRFYSAGTAEQKRKVIEDIKDWNRSNPHFAITRESLLRSVRQRRRIEALTKKGVYTPKGQAGWAEDKQRSY